MRYAGFETNVSRETSKNFVRIKVIFRRFSDGDLSHEVRPGLIGDQKYGDVSRETSQWEN